VSCIHRWRLTEPDGPTSLGTCRLCGLTRRFSNVFYGDADDLAAVRRRTRPYRERRPVRRASA